MSITLSTLMRISFTLFYRVNETQLFHALVLHLGCVCFGWKWFQEIIFPQTRMFGCHGKWLPVDQYFHLWPGNDFPPSFSLQIISGKREKEREERAQIRERERERRESPDRAARPTIAPRRRAAWSTIAIDEIVRRDRWSSGAIAIVDCAARRTIAPTSPPLDVAFTARSHLLLRRIWFISFAAFCFFCRIWCIFCKNVWMNQIPKLIFRKTNFVTAKHMKTFSFSENSISGKWNIFRKYFYANQCQHIKHI